MRRYIDLNVDMELFLKNPTFRVAYEIKRSGLHGIAVSSDSKMNDEDLKSIKKTLKEYGLDVVSRVNFEPKNRSQLLNFLRRNRLKYEVIGIKPLTNELATLSARDRRVDLIYYDLNNRKIAFRESTAHVCAGALEIQVRPLLALSTREGIHKILIRLIREARVAVEHDIPIVITSSARNMTEIRAARDMAALAKCLGLGEGCSLDAVSKNPIEIITRNRLKLSRGHIVERAQIGDIE
ncbi:MAG: RNase P subunit p30 family protein [Candidatus Bathyarchaeia archaeon]